MRRFDGKVVLITGAGIGLGQAVALAFAKEGARLVLSDIDASANQATLELVQQLGCEAFAVTADVSNRASVEALVTAAITRFGHLDVAVNNAGTHEPPGSFFDTGDDIFERVIGVNLRGVWLCMQAELRAMLPRASGAIINISAITDSVGAPAMSVYVASKHGVLGLTRSAALEFAKSGIRINAVSPAAMRTPMFEAAAQENPEFVAQGQAAHPIGRVAEPAEVAGAVLFLASEDASFVLGHSLKVDGGYTAA